MIIFQYNLAPTPEPSDEDIDTSDEDDEFGGGGRNDNPEDQTASKITWELALKSF